MMNITAKMKGTPRRSRRSRAKPIAPCFRMAGNVNRPDTKNISDMKKTSLKFSA